MSFLKFKLSKQNLSHQHVCNFSFWLFAMAAFTFSSRMAVSAVSVLNHRRNHRSGNQRRKRQSGHRKKSKGRIEDAMMRKILFAQLEFSKIYQNIFHQKSQNRHTSYPIYIGNIKDDVSSFSPYLEKSCSKSPKNMTH